jgi:peptide/nickel transport system substrate-binding protein
MKVSVWALILVVGFGLLTLPVGAGQAPAGAVVYPIVADPTFNPWHPRAFVESVFPNRVIFNGLTKPGKDLQPAPDLAERWEVSKDGLSWTFFLRKNVKWHDGRDFTADDVKFTYDLVLNPKLAANAAANFRSVKEIVVVDKSTVRFMLTTPTASLAAFAGTNAGILPKHAFEGVADPWAHDAFNKRAPIGTGAYRVQEYVPGSHVTLARNDAYFLGRPTIDTITFKVLPDPNAQIAQVLSGELTLDIIENPANVRPLQARPEIGISTVPQVNFYYLAPNYTNPIFKDRRVRQAMLYALNRKAMINGFLQGFAREATGILSPALAYYYRPDVKTYEFDRAKARALLAEAGWRPGPDGMLAKDGQHLKFTLTFPRVQYFEQLAALIQQYYRAVGIEVTLDGLEFNQFISQRFLPRKFDVVAGWWVTPADPDFYNYLHSTAGTGGFNVPVYANSEMDRLLEQGRAASDPTQRAATYRKFQELVAEELPYVYLWWPLEIRAINKRLTGVPEIGLRDAFQYTQEWRLR